jgi:hypothetical protein
MFVNEGDLYLFLDCIDFGDLWHWCCCRQVASTLKDVHSMVVEGASLTEYPALPFTHQTNTQHATITRMSSKKSLKSHDTSTEPNDCCRGLATTTPTLNPYQLSSVVPIKHELNACWILSSRTCMCTVRIVCVHLHDVYDSYIKTWFSILQ